jgi:hypothetical protein
MSVGVPLVKFIDQAAMHDQGVVAMATLLAEAIPVWIKPSLLRSVRL